MIQHSAIDQTIGVRGKQQEQGLNGIDFENANAFEFVFDDIQQKTVEPFNKVTHA